MPIRFRVLNSRLFPGPLSTKRPPLESSFFRVWWHLSDAVAVLFLRNRKGAGDHLNAEEVGPIVSIEGIPSAS